MKRLFLLCFYCLPFLTMGQSPLDEDGNQISFSSGYTTSGIPVNLNIEMGVTEKISFGIEGNLRYFDEAGDSTNFTHTITGLVFFGNFYFNEWLNLDDKKWGVYGGIHLGYYKWVSPAGYVEEGESSSTLAGGAQLGGRYYFGKRWGVYLEAHGNNDNAGAKLGVTYKLR